MSKNLCGKTREMDEPYEVWQAQSPSGPWTWRVLKKYQAPHKEAMNPLARWFCFVTSPFCPTGEYGDVYVKDITGTALRIDNNEEE
jgi:hypothetical protein